MKRPGFTLLELLIMVTLLGMTMAAVTQLLAANISGSTKATVQQQIKENGQFAISQIEQTIRRSSQVSVCNGTTLRVIVPEPSGSTYTDTTYTYSWSAINETLQLNTTFLVDQSLDVIDFSCTSIASSGDRPTYVKVSFSIEKAGLGARESGVAQTFETTASLRTY